MLYAEIKEYILTKYGIKLTMLYIAQIKDKGRAEELQHQFRKSKTADMPSGEGRGNHGRFPAF